MAPSSAPLQPDPFVVMPAVSWSGPPSLSGERWGRHQQRKEKHSVNIKNIKRASGFKGDGHHLRDGTFSSVQLFPFLLTRNANLLKQQCTHFCDSFISFSKVQNHETVNY